jgi:hypothetical protein
MFRQGKQQYMRVRRVVVVLILCWLPFHGMAHGKFFSADYTFAPGTEPNGFDRIKWGTAIASLDPWKNMELLTKIGLSTYYKRKTEDLQFSIAHLDEVIYEFWDGKFAGVVIRTTGYSNYMFLREYCFKRFGPGDRTAANAKMDVQDFLWNGYETRMQLTYNERNRLGEVRLISIKMENQRNAMQQLGTKEGKPGQVKEAGKGKPR